MQNQILQSSAKFMHCKKQNTNLVYSYIHTFSRNLCFNSYFKNRFSEAFLMKVIDTKKIHYLHLTL